MRGWRGLRKVWKSQTISTCTHKEPRARNAAAFSRARLRKGRVAGAGLPTLELEVELEKRGLREPRALCPGLAVVLGHEQTSAGRCERAGERVLPSASCACDG